MPISQIEQLIDTIGREYRIDNVTTAPFTVHYDRAATISIRQGGWSRVKTKEPKRFNPLSILFDKEKEIIDGTR